VNRIRSEIHKRFLAVVQRGLARADRERAEHLAALRPPRRLTDQERGRLHDFITNPRTRRPAAAREEEDE